jgi:phosphate transport system substrate-binding protein
MNEIARKTSTWRVVIVGVLLLLLAVAGCTSGSSESAATTAPATEPEVELTTSGSGTTTAILAAIAPSFEADMPGYRLNVLPGAGTGGGVDGIVTGMLDVAAMARPPKEDEAVEGVEYMEFGLSATAVYAHPSVGVTELTSSEIADIFYCEIENWSEVGGPDLPVVVYVRDEGDSSTKGLRSAVFGEELFPADVRILTSQSDMQAHVADTEGAVGFGSWPAAVAEGAEVLPIALDGVSPSDGAYPCTAPVGIGYMSGRQEDVQPLIDWLNSESGRAALREVDVIIP